MQTSPHDAQLVTECATHLPPQESCVELHVTPTQLPPEHEAAQATPHLPQLALSVLVLVHAAPQTVWPEGQAHVPLEQVVPDLQALPQEPQFLESVLVFVHDALHMV